VYHWYLFGPPKQKPKPFGLSFFMGLLLKHRGFPVRMSKVLASFVLAAEMVWILRKAVQASKKKPQIELFREPQTQGNLQCDAVEVSELLCLYTRFLRFPNPPVLHLL
jgi:hypothetical protein